MTKPPVVGVVGWKNAGKTTLVEKLIAGLCARGFRVASLKHTHHNVDVDTPGTDSFRHRAAGAHEVMLASSSRWSLIHEHRNEDEPALDALLARFSPSDVVIMEGFKTSDFPKIEVRRAGAKRTDPLDETTRGIVALVTDTTDAQNNLPTFHIDDIDAILIWMINRFGITAKGVS